MIIKPGNSQRNIITEGSTQNHNDFQDQTLATQQRERHKKSH